MTSPKQGLRSIQFAKKLLWIGNLIVFYLRSKNRLDRATAPRCCPEAASARHPVASDRIGRSPAASGTRPRAAPLPAPDRPFSYSRSAATAIAGPDLAKAPVAQLDRAPDYESGGQEFESLRARHGR
jgi:hypothetical protein